MLIESKLSTQRPSTSGNSEAANSPEHRTFSDWSLWEAFKKGDESAFITIYKENANILYTYGCQFSPDNELVKDCLQDFFIYLRKNREGFGETDSIKMYLFKAFRRRVIDYHKKYSRESQWNESFAFTQFPVELSSESIYINRQIESEQLEKLNKALKGLNSKEREAIYYFYYEGLSYLQIAEILNFTHVSSARRLMYRGLSHLRKFFR
ncbi:RNA polymerase sigma factor [Catalinimonas niigatensis]|uniref:RNA polymerase sigma factor n=1 Tax=Catalinimonas niigatensis TaxID=1397264 RepID=UPI002665FC4B|nr:sigma-70 family RNA polymerase sigma factor [Catalinimonas niigatensis]WPP49181.1 sigma-70 family RNA polymerase sigma factor [Catalinimonas niigatensis]